MMRLVWQRLSMPVQFLIRVMRYKNVKGEHISIEDDSVYESIVAYIEESITIFNESKQNEVRAYMQEIYKGDTGSIQRDRRFFFHFKIVAKTIEQVISSFQDFTSQQDMEDFCKRMQDYVIPSQSHSQSRSQMQSQMLPQMQSLSNPPLNQQAAAGNDSGSDLDNEQRRPIPDSQPSYIPTPQTSQPYNSSRVHFLNPHVQVAASRPSQLVTVTPRKTRKRLQPQPLQNDEEVLSQLQSIHNDINTIHQQQIVHSELLLKVCRALDITTNHFDVAQTSGLI